MIDLNKITLKNNAMFNIVMRRENLCRMCLERILNKKITRISYPENEKVIDIDLNAKSIRLDIFICTFDPFGYGRHLYSFENVCLQDFNISLNDKTTKIFLNTKGTMEDIPTPLRNFLNYIDSGEITDEYTKELDETVIQVRQDKKWREKIMTLEEYAQATAKVASKEAVDSINELYSYLLENDRLDDLKKAVSDEEFRKRLLEDYKQKL